MACGLLAPGPLLALALSLCPGDTADLDLAWDQSPSCCHYHCCHLLALAPSFLSCRCSSYPHSMTLMPKSLLPSGFTLIPNLLKELAHSALAFNSELCSSFTSCRVFLLCSWSNSLESSGSRQPRGHHTKESLCSSLAKRESKSEDGLCHLIAV